MGGAITRHDLRGQADARSALSKSRAPLMVFSVMVFDSAAGKWLARGHFPTAQEADAECASLIAGEFAGRERYVQVRAKRQS